MILHFLGDDLGLGLRLKTDSMSSRRASVFHPTTKAGDDKSEFDNLKKWDEKFSVFFCIILSESQSKKNHHKSRVSSRCHLWPQCEEQAQLFIWIMYAEIF